MYLLRYSRNKMQIHNIEFTSESCWFSTHKFASETFTCSKSSSNFFKLFLTTPFTSISREIVAFNSSSLLFDWIFTYNFIVFASATWLCKDFTSSKWAFWIATKASLFSWSFSSAARCLWTLLSTTSFDIFKS